MIEHDLIFAEQYGWHSGYKVPSFYELVETYPTAREIHKKYIRKQIGVLEDRRISMRVHGDIFDSVKDIDKNIDELNFQLEYIKNIDKPRSTFGLTKDQIEKARAVPIRDFLRVGGSKKAHCLFHNDKHESMHVYTNSYYCFSCEAHGSTIDIVMQLYGLKFNEAVRRLIP